MGNHCEVCEFCGRDQRDYGIHCCSQSLEASRAKQAAVASQQDALASLLVQQGISFTRTESGRVIPSIGSFTRFLASLQTRHTVT